MYGSIEIANNLTVNQTPKVGGKNRWKQSRGAIGSAFIYLKFNTLVVNFVNFCYMYVHVSGGFSTRTTLPKAVPSRGKSLVVKIRLKFPDDFLK